MTLLKNIFLILDDMRGKNTKSDSDAEPLAGLDILSIPFRWPFLYARTHENQIDLVAVLTALLKRQIIHVDISR